MPTGIYIRKLKGKYINCKICGKKRYIMPAQVKRNEGIYCSYKCMGKAKKGIFPPQLTDFSIKGKYFGKKENLFKKGHIGKAGAENPMWRGGISTQDKLQRMRFNKTIQKEILKRDNYICQICGQKGGKLQVDHIQKWSEYVELRFEMSNCRTLCQECHYEITWGKPLSDNAKNWGHSFPKEELNK